MSKAPPFTELSPWEDRWNVPTEEQLLVPYKEREQATKMVQQLKEGLSCFEGFERQMLFHGEGWKWSWVYRQTLIKHPEAEQMVFLVPHPDNMNAVVPMTEEFLEALPFRRLNRFIRDAIKSATNKQCAEYRWVHLVPTAASEVEHTMDLVKRKIKFYTAKTAK